MSKITATVVGDSLSPQGHRLVTLEIVFPRFILAELNTHRVLSKNSASSRAIPFKKMVEMVKENPFIPIAWQKEHKGMQGSEYFTSQSSIDSLEGAWLYNRTEALKAAASFTEFGLTKQLCNRLLEPFMMHKVLISGTEWENFFKLRCPQYEFNSFSTKQVFYYRSKKDLLKNHPENNIPDDWTDIDWLLINKGQAEIHMMALAEAIWDAMNESTPNQLKAGDWHIPYLDKITFETDSEEEDIDQMAIKISTGMAARTSYTTVGDEKEISQESLIGIHDKMLNSSPMHSSPFEHCAKVMSDDEYSSYTHGTPYRKGWPVFYEGWCRNYRGFIQYREIIENGTDQTS